MNTPMINGTRKPEFIKQFLNFKCVRTLSEYCSYRGYLMLSEWPFILSNISIESQIYFFFFGNEI